MSRHARRFDWDEARQLHSQGMSYAAIGRELGVSAEAVRRVVLPGEKERVARYQKKRADTGVCSECGGPKNRHSNYRGVTRCKRCAAVASRKNIRPDTLRCIACREWKPDESFPRNRREEARRGRHESCRTCTTQQKRDYRARVREKAQANDAGKL